MKLYKDIDVDLTYQNCGSTWLGVLRGKQDDIELVFNGLFNFGATSGKLDYQGGDGIATFWTNKQALRYYFFTRYFFPKCGHDDKEKRPWRNHPAYKPALRYADNAIAELKETSHEMFTDFRRKSGLDTYSTGTMSAERPDMDMKDAILSHAFEDKESVTKT